MIADNIVADSYLLANLRRDIADDIIAGLFILFDVDSEPEDHSEVLLLFVGCIVNFIVSYLMCMFQDSVPAGSYNDPFLSSVCGTSEKMKNFFYLMISILLVFDLGFLLFLLFISIAMSVSASNPMQGTWHTIRDHVQRSYLIVWDTEPDQLCVPAPIFHCLWRPAKPSTGMSFFNLFQTKQLYGFRNLTELHQNQKILRART